MCCIDLLGHGHSDHTPSQRVFAGYVGEIKSVADCMSKCNYGLTVVEQTILVTDSKKVTCFSTIFLQGMRRWGLKKPLSWVIV